jgi:mannosyltransferase OCH1-like enzyme
MSFPRRIFQTWKSKTIIPQNMAYWQSTWLEYNPKYIYDFWDDADNRAFIAEHYAWFLPQYDAYNQTIKRVDAIRYFYLYHYGGIYADMDFECLRSFEDLLASVEDKSDVILCQMRSDNRPEHNTPNAIMISKPREPFWLFVIYKLLTTNINLIPELSTGPVLLKSALELYQESDKNFDNLSWYNELLKKVPQPDNKEHYSRIGIVSWETFYPIDWRDWHEHTTLRDPVAAHGEIYDKQKVATLFPKSYAVTYWVHSW